MRAATEGPPPPPLPVPPRSRLALEARGVERGDSAPAHFEHLPRRCMRSALGWGAARRGARAAGGVARGAQVKVTRRARPPRHVAAQRPSTGPVTHKTTAPRSDHGALQQVTLGTAAALCTRHRRRRLRAAAFRVRRRWPSLWRRDLGRALALCWRRRRQLLLREQRLELCETAVHRHEVVAETHERRLVLRGAGHDDPRPAKAAPMEDLHLVLEGFSHQPTRCGDRRSSLAPLFIDVSPGEFYRLR